MKIYRTRRLAALGVIVGLAALIASVIPVAAQEDPLVEQLAAIVLQIEDELQQAGVPKNTIARCRNAVVDSQATGLDREIFISNLIDELSPIVEDEVALQSSVDAVDALVAQYQDLTGEE